MMASNPMQRKSRNSFLLGVIVTLLIAGVVIAMLLLMLKQKNEELEAEKLSRKKVYTLTADVKAAEVITKDMIQLKSMNSDSIPSNATALQDVVDSWFLQTKEGEYVNRDQYGLYLDRTEMPQLADKIIEIVINENEEIEDVNGKSIKVGDFYTDIAGKITKVSIEENTNSVMTGGENDDNILPGELYTKIGQNTKKVTKIMVDETAGQYRWFYTDKVNDTMTRIYQEGAGYEFYRYKIEADTNQIVKEYIDIKDVPVIARIDMMANTVMTQELVVQSDEIVTDDTRKEEYNMITLPIDLMPDDYIDIRLKTPTGQNFIVVSKVLVDIPMNADGTYISNAIRVNLREDEILLMSSAIVEAYGLPGAELYVTKYVDPAMQEAAIPTYVPNAAVTAQINANPNIVQLAKEELVKIGTNAAIEARNKYLQQSIDGSEDYWDNIPDAVEESMGTSITTRQQYLKSLAQ